MLRLCKSTAVWRRLGLATALVCTGWCVDARGAAIYEVPEVANEVVGAWDVNILADDVHFAHASVLRQVRIRLAIAGVQACKLWIFDGLNREALHTVVFTNQPATGTFHMSTYDFDMQLQVPKDIYVGFSAQGGGWGGAASDYWSWGSVVTQGVAGTVGEYYYGPVSGGQLTTVFPTGNGAMGCLQILSEPVRIESVAWETGQVRLAIGMLPIHATNAVARGAAVDGALWEEEEILPLGVSNHVWSATNASAARAFYRISTR